MSDSQKELSDVQLARIEEINNNEYKFKKRGNEEQYKVNQKVGRKMKEAEAILQENGDTAKEAAQAKISEGCCRCFRCVLFLLRCLSFKKVNTRAISFINNNPFMYLFVFFNINRYTHA